MERDTLALSALLQRKSPAHGLVAFSEAPAFPRELSGITKKKPSGTLLSRSGKTPRKTDRQKERAVLSGAPKNSLINENTIILVQGK